MVLAAPASGTGAMMEAKTLDVSHLLPYEISTQAPLWWGQLLLTFIEATMFSLLVAAFLYVRLQVDVWPPPGDQLPHVLLPTLALVPLLLSVIGSYVATEAAKKNDRRGMALGMGLNLLFAGVFLVLRIVEWHSFNYSYKADSFGSYMWAFMALHSFDFVASMIETLVLLVIILSGRYGERERAGVHVDSVIYYFVAVIWVPLYVVLYWGPRILESQ
jgi:heme/copper-type cytochrome/quinol oxidase subunit 3